MMPKIFLFATKGTQTNDELRIVTLLAAFQPTIIPFDYQAKLRSSREIIRQSLQERPDLLVMEGTGIAGGLACLYLKLIHRIPYVFSSGDAVAPFIGLNWPWLVPLFTLYEWLLCRYCAGFIGWTPYLVGRSLTFGAPKGMTAAGWVHFNRTPEQLQHSRQRLRQELGIPETAIVFGLLGSLVWNSRYQYCYGDELIHGIQQCDRQDVYVLIVGDGSGLEYLKTLAGEKLGKTIFLPGNVPLEHVMDYLSVIDIASLPQSVDGVGNFRYTTKVCEYLAARLPIVINQIPMAYDLIEAVTWRLPGASPWSSAYRQALAQLMHQITPADLQQKRAVIPPQLPEFDLSNQVERAERFITELFPLKADDTPAHKLGQHG
jgi:glycosyltransferase involved in cell wall biosynthesis